MSLLRKLGNCWLGVIYRRQTPQRLKTGVHRASAASSRSCSNCLRWNGGSASGASVFKRCMSQGLMAHRRDICKKFVLNVELRNARQPAPVAAEDEPMQPALLKEWKSTMPALRLDDQMVDVVLPATRTHEVPAPAPSCGSCHAGPAAPVHPAPCPVDPQSCWVMRLQPLVQAPALTPTALAVQRRRPALPPPMRPLRRRVR